MRRSRRLEDRPGGGHHHLYAYRQCEDAEYRHRRFPLRTENQQDQLRGREVEDGRQRKADPGQHAHHFEVGFRKLAQVVLELGENGVHHRRNNVGDVLQRQHHQPVRFFVEAQRTHAHVFAYQ